LLTVERNLKFRFNFFSVGIDAKITTMERRQQSNNDATKQITEYLRTLSEGQAAQSELMAKVISENIVRKEALMRKLPLACEADFEEFFEIEENRNQLTDYISANVPACDDFGAQVFNKVLKRDVIARYTWPTRR
jgi:hypothetical protein